MAFIHINRHNSNGEEVHVFFKFIGVNVKMVLFFYRRLSTCDEVTSHWTDLGPGFVRQTFLLDEVALDSLPSVIVGEFPDQPHGRPGNVSHPQVLRGPGDICTVDQRTVREQEDGGRR